MQEPIVDTSPSFISSGPRPVERGRCGARLHSTSSIPDCRPTSSRPPCMATNRCQKSRLWADGLCHKVCWVHCEVTVGLLCHKVCWVYCEVTVTVVKDGATTHLVGVCHGAVGLGHQ